MQSLLHAFARFDAAHSESHSRVQNSNLSKIATRSLSILLALTLALTMCPAAGLAYAAEGAGDGAGNNAVDNSGAAADSASDDVSGGPSDGHISEDAVLDTSGSMSAGSGGSAADAADGSSDAADSSTGSASSDASSKYTSSSNGQTSADVSLAGDATVGTIEYNGLAYTINEDDSSTVSVTGLASAKPTGDVQIPAQIASGGKMYAVTAIKAPGLADDANPYAEELFGDGAKALAVKSISIPQTVASIDPAFFQLFPNTTDINVSTENETYTSYDGALYDADLTQLILVPQGKGSLVLPQPLASVPAYVFSQCNKLSAISFTGSTGNETFAVQNNVLYTNDLSTLLAAPSGLGASASVAAECITIAEGAFFGNAVLDTIVVDGIVEGIASAGDSALDANGQPLMGGSAVDGSTLPTFDGTTVENATVVINVSAEADGDEASAMIERAKAAWVAYGFTNFKEPASPGTEIVPEEGSGFAFTLLPDYTLSVRWAGATEPPAAIDIPDYGIIDGAQYTVSTIADNGFSNYTSLITVDIPQTVTSIGDSAFELCTSLQTVHFDSVVSIGSKAFANTALLSLVLPTTVQSIGDNAFSNMKETTIVALGSIADNSPIALGAAAGLSVYVPYGTESTWDAGIPTLGNHIYPYGVKLADELLELEVGQTTNINDSGYIEAPGAIEATYAYKANPISVNTETGEVEAKANGSTYINISLSITVDQVAVKRQNSIDAKLRSIAVPGVAESDIALLSQQIELTAASMNAMTYSAVSQTDAAIDYSQAQKLDTVDGKGYAYWAIRDGIMYIWCERDAAGNIGVIAESNFTGWTWVTAHRLGDQPAASGKAWYKQEVRDMVTEIRMSDSCRVQDTTPDSAINGAGMLQDTGMSLWFAAFPNLRSTDGVFIPDGVKNTFCLFLNDDSLTETGAIAFPESVLNVRSMFDYCDNLSVISSGFSLPRTSIACYLFQNTTITEIPEGFEIPSSGNVSYMFSACKSLEYLPSSIRLDNQNSSEIFLYTGDGIKTTYYAGELRNLVPTWGATYTPSGATAPVTVTEANVIDWWNQTFNRELKKIETKSVKLMVPASVVTGVDSSGGWLVWTHVAAAADGTVQLPQMNPNEFTGYDFIGWYDDENYTRPYFPNTIVDTQITYYGKFAPHMCDVSFEGLPLSLITESTISNMPDSLTIQQGKTIGTVRTPTLEGYVFAGWYDDAQSNASEWNLHINAVRDHMTLTAHWKPIEYTISLDYVESGASGPSDPYKRTIEDSVVFPAAEAVTNKGKDLFNWTAAEGLPLIGSSLQVGADGNWTLSVRDMYDAGLLSDADTEVTFKAGYEDARYTVDLYAYGDKSVSAASTEELKVDSDIALSSIARPAGFEPSGSGDGFPGGYAITGWAQSPSIDPSDSSTGSIIPNTTQSVSDIVTYVTGDVALDAPLNADGKRHVELYAIWTPVYSTTLPVGATDKASFAIDVAKSSDTVAADQNVNMETRTRAELDIEARSSATTDPSDASRKTAEHLFGSLDGLTFDYRQKSSSADDTSDVPDADRAPFSLAGSDWVKVGNLAASSAGEVIANYGDLYLTYKDAVFPPDLADSGSLTKDWGEIARIEWKASMRADTIKSYLFASPDDPRISGM